MAKLKRSKGISQIKRSNIHYSKLQKRGKIKNSKTDSLPPHLLKRLKQQVQSQNGKAPVEKMEDEEVYDVEDMLDNEDEDGHNDNNNDLNTRDHYDGEDAFIKSARFGGKSINDYENGPRVFEDFKNSACLKHMLPIKRGKGVIPVTMPFTEESEADEQDDGKRDIEGKVDENEESELEIESNMQSGSQKNYDSCSAIQLLFIRQKMLTEMKLKISKLANDVIENPDERMGLLKELRLLLETNDPLIRVTVNKLVMISLLEVFKDIIPGYRIRTLTETEKNVKLKKDTLILQNSENKLIMNYKAYLMKLESISAVLLKKQKKKNKNRPGQEEQKNDISEKITEEAENKLAAVAVQCLCDLLTEHPHFNYRTNIIVTLVPFTCIDNKAVSDLCCKTLRTIYRRDHLGDISLEAVKQSVKLIKSKSFNVPPKVLETFLSLKIKEAKLENKADEIARKKAERKKESDAKKKMSKRDLKRKKKMAKLETQLLEADGEESKQKRMKFQTEIVKQVFLIYFRVLKSAPQSILISTVLEGLAKFSHLINIDFFDDLVTVLHSLIESGTLNYRQSLHSIQTVVNILSGHGEALNIDPLRFYTHLYKTLFALNAGESSTDVPVALACLDVMINKRRKQVSYQRVVAFAKRTLTMALQLRHNGAIAILGLIRSFMLNHSRVDILLDTDVSQAAGVYLPELEEPEYCNATSTAFWELHYLRHHYHPVVRQLAIHLSIGAPILGNGQLSTDISRRSAKELFEDFNDDDEFKPPPPKPKPKKLSKQKSRTLLYHWTALDREIRTAMDKIETEIKVIDSDSINCDSIIT